MNSALGHGPSGTGLGLMQLRLCARSRHRNHPNISRLHKGKRNLSPSPPQGQPEGPVPHEEGPDKARKLIHPPS